MMCPRSSEGKPRRSEWRFSAFAIVSEPGICQLMVVLIWRHCHFCSSLYCCYGLCLASSINRYGLEKRKDK